MRRKEERCEAVCQTQAEATRRAGLLRRENEGRRYWVVRALDRWAVQSEPREQSPLLEEEDETGTAP